MAARVLDQDKLYEWFIVDSHPLTRVKKHFHNIRWQCVTEDVKVSEQYHLPDEKICEALKNRIEQLDGTYKNQAADTYFIRGFHMYAKVSMYVESDGTLKYVFNPFSFTRIMNKVGAEKVNVREVVTSLMIKHPERKELLEVLEKMGREYVREYRKIESGS